MAFFDGWGDSFGEVAGGLDGLLKTGTGLLEDAAKAKGAFDYLTGSSKGKPVYTPLVLTQPSNVQTAAAKPASNGLFVLALVGIGVFLVARG